MTVAFIDRHRAALGVESICRTLQFAPSAYYERKQQEVDPERRSPRQKSDEALRPTIRRVWDDNFQAYGARKVWLQLKREGIEAARCSIERLMREMGLRGVVRGRTARTTIAADEDPRPLDLVQRRLRADRPNQLWVADFTYVATWSGFVYVAFDRLSHDLESQINAALSSAKSTILDKLDDDVASKLRLREREALDFISVQERDLYRLTKHIIGPSARWDDSSVFFSLDSPPSPSFPSGRYQLHPDTSAPAHLYRLQHLLAQYCIATAKALPLASPPATKLTFVYTGIPKMSRVASLIDSSGWLSISVLTAASHTATEDLLVATALLDDDSLLDPEVALQLFSCDATLAPISSRPPVSLADEHELTLNGTIQTLKDRNHKYFGDEFDKLELWASDLKNVLDKELSTLEQKMSDEMRASALSISLDERLEHTRTYHRLERQRNDKRKKIFEAQDDISAKRDSHIADIEKSLSITDSSRLLFTIRFEVMGQ